MQPGDSGLDLLQDEFLRDALTGRDSCKVTWEYAYKAPADIDVFLYTQRLDVAITHNSLSWQNV